MRPTRGWLVAVVLALLTVGCGSTVEQSTSLGSTAGNTAGSQDGLSVTGAGSSVGGPTVGTTGGAGLSTGGGTAGETTGGAGSGTVGFSGTTSATLTSVPGVTPTQIYVGVTYSTGSDQANQALGNNITTGDQKGDAQAVIDDINAHGGVAGRKLVPIWYDFQETDARPYATIDSEACAKFTQDNHVFAVAGDGITDNFPACIQKAGAFLVSSASGIIGPDKAFFDRFRYLFSVGYLSQDRMMAEEVHSLVRQNYFTGWDSVNGAPGPTPAKIGIISFDTSSWNTPLDHQLLPGLARAGHPVDPTNVQRVTYPSDTNQVGSSVADIQSAVLKFRQNNVTHVIVLDGNGSLTLHMLNNMRGQHYYPRLGVNSASGVEALYTQYAEDAKSFNGAVGLGWLPVLDLPAGAGDRYNTSQTKGCISMVEKRTGQQFADTNAASVALGYCDELYLLADAINHSAGSLSRTGVSAAIEALHGSFSASGTRGLFFSPARHDGIQYGYDLSFDSGCGCVKYGRGPFPIPDV